MRFDPAGTKLFYTLKSATNGDRVFVRSLADDSTQELVVATGEEVAHGYDLLPVNGDSVLVAVRPNASSAPFTRRVFLDDAKEPQQVAEGDIVAHSADNHWVVGRNLATKMLELVRIEPYVSRPLPVPHADVWNEYTVGVVGSHAFYVAADGLHLSGLTATDELEDTVISGPDANLRPCYSLAAPGPKDRLAFLRGSDAELALVALKENLPKLAGFRPPAGSSAACPTWGDEGNTLGFVVTGADGSSRAYVSVATTSNTPPMAKVVSDTARRVYAVMHR